VQFEAEHQTNALKQTLYGAPDPLQHALRVFIKELIAMKSRKLACVAGGIMYFDALMGTAIVLAPSILR
jgi:hypothetical protein